MHRTVCDIWKGRRGSGGWIRTNDQRINSPLRYRCATPDQPRGGAYSRPVATDESPPGGVNAAQGKVRGRNRTAVAGFADLCLTTRPPDRRGRTYRCASIGPAAQQVKRRAARLGLAASGADPISAHPPGALEVVASWTRRGCAQRMVDGQLRPNRVTDPRLLARCANCRASASCRGRSRRAYADEDVPLPGGRGDARAHGARPAAAAGRGAAGDRALVVGAGTGYGAAGGAHGRTGDRARSR